jgi:microcystin-dependent protein
MTLYAPLDIQNGTYSATLDRQLLHMLFSAAGVVGASDLVVAQRAAGTNMSVDVAAGRAVVLGTDQADQGKYLCWSDAVTNVVIAAAPGTGLSRIDLIVAKVRDADQNGGVNNDWVIQAVTGSAASTPTTPATPASSLVLATISVAASVTAIVNANIVSTQTPATSREWTVGDYKESASTTAQAGWLYCDGSAVSRSTFSALYGKVGTTYGVGNGVTTFNIPDRRGRVGVGVGTVGTNSQPTVAIGATSGEQNHTLAVSEIPAGLTVTDPQHSHPTTGSSFIIGSTAASTIFTNSGTNVDHSPAWNLGGVGSTSLVSTGISVGGGGSTHNNMQPYIGVAFFIKT